MTTTFEISISPIVTRDLSMRFGRESALTDLCLTIPSGAIYALVGPKS
jgi:ABC-type multidrug transport system ATPase subunit